jgi:hypothetical protein
MPESPDVFRRLRFNGCSWAGGSWDCVITYGKAGMEFLAQHVQGPTGKRRDLGPRGGPVNGATTAPQPTESLLDHLSQQLLEQVTRVGVQPPEVFTPLRRRAAIQGWSESRCCEHLLVGLV